MTTLGREPVQDGAVEGPRLLVERPPPGLARGEYAWPAWAIASVGIAAVLLGLAYLLWRLRGLRRR